MVSSRCEGRLGVDHWPMRRWTSPVAGSITISGFLRDEDHHAGNGVNAQRFSYRLNVTVSTSPSQRHRRRIFDDRLRQRSEELARPRRRDRVHHEDSCRQRTLPTRRRRPGPHLRADRRCRRTAVHFPRRRDARVHQGDRLRRQRIDQRHRRRRQADLPLPRWKPCLGAVRGMRLRPAPGRSHLRDLERLRQLTQNSFGFVSRRTNAQRLARLVRRFFALRIAPCLEQVFERLSLDEGRHTDRFEGNAQECLRRGQSTGRWRRREIVGAPCGHTPRHLPRTPGRRPGERRFAQPCFTFLILASTGAPSHEPFFVRGEVIERRLRDVR